MCVCCQNAHIISSSSSVNYAATQYSSVARSPPDVTLLFTRRTANPRRRHRNPGPVTTHAKTSPSPPRGGSGPRFVFSAVILLGVSGVAELSGPDAEVNDDGEGDDVWVELLPVQLVDAHRARFLKNREGRTLHSCFHQKNSRTF